MSQQKRLLFTIERCQHPAQIPRAGNSGQNRIDVPLVVEQASDAGADLRQYLIIDPEGR